MGNSTCHLHGSSRKSITVWPACKSPQETTAPHQETRSRSPHAHRTIHRLRHSLYIDDLTPKGVALPFRCYTQLRCHSDMGSRLASGCFKTCRDTCTASPAKQHMSVHAWSSHQQCISSKTVCMNTLHLYVKANLARFRCGSESTSSAVGFIASPPTGPS